MRWIVPTVDASLVARLARGLGVTPLLARLLVLRGVETAAAAEAFLHPSLSRLHDPFLMAGMKEAVERLGRAIARREKILIYGDYDVDGTMAAVVLMTALRSLGAPVETYIPDRFADGYGMRIPVVERAAAEGARVVVSVDTGVREHEVIARARQWGVDSIVTDHHQPGERLPAALAVLNPRRADCPYPEKNLAGVGVAFKLAQALLAGAAPGASERLTESYLKIVAIGTIADVVPLTGENRVIARFGLAGLEKPAHAGLRALLDVCGLNGRPVTTGDVAFRLAPRLNAAGRMDSARQVIELFAAADEAAGRTIAERLDELNRQRQQVEEGILDEVLARLDREPGRARRNILVFSGEGWHRGVIGIVAQRVVERFHRPAVIIGIEDGVGQGSGRSIARFNLLEAFTRSARLFNRYGGHALAAGFTLPADRIEELGRELESYAQSVLAPGDLDPVLRVDAEITLEEINEELFRRLEELAPYGCGNPPPVFAARGLRLADQPRVLKEKHLRLRVAQRGRTFDAFWWGGAGRAAPLTCGDELDAAFTVEENVYQERSSLRLIVKDLGAHR